MTAELAFAFSLTPRLISSVNRDGGKKKNLEREILVRLLVDTAFEPFDILGIKGNADEEHKNSVELCNRYEKISRYFH